MKGYSKKQARRYLKNGYLRKGFKTECWVKHSDLSGDIYVTEIYPNEKRVAKEIMRIGWNPYSDNFNPLQIPEKVDI